MKKILTFTVLLTAYLGSSAQQQFYETEYVDVGNIKALMNVHGSLWDDSSFNSRCEFPKGSGKHIASSGALWMGGFSGGNLAAAANMYEFEFSPGPILYTGQASITPAESQKWAKIWKVSRAEINTFLASTSHTVSNTPASVLDWPGTGNVHATGNSGVPLFAPMNDYSRSFAPFADVNGNGIYDPLNGDYPEIIGDQGLWMLFNDVASQHKLTKTPSLGVEVQLLAYAYGRNSVADNIIFYNYKIINRVGTMLDSFKVGFFADMDLGYAWDDYMGYDSSRNLGVVYNAKSVDGGSFPTTDYGTNVPKAGIQVLKMPGMSCSTFKPAGSFMYMNNVGAGLSSITYEPQNAVEFYNYLSSSFRNGQHLRNDYQGAALVANGLGSGPDAKYAFDGDITDVSQWSECAAANPTSDKKMMIATESFAFAPGSVVEFSVALVASNPASNNGCATSSFADIQEVADTAKKIFCTPLPHSTATTSIPGVGHEAVSLYPNPATDRLYIRLPDNNEADVKVYDALGRKIHIDVMKQGNIITVQTGHLSAGFYTLRLKGKDLVYTSKFLKK